MGEQQMLSKDLHQKTPPSSPSLSLFQHEILFVNYFLAVIRVPRNSFDVSVNFSSNPQITWVNSSNHTYQFSCILGFLRYISEVGGVGKGCDLMITNVRNSFVAHSINIHPTNSRNRGPRPAQSMLPCFCHHCTQLRQITTHLIYILNPDISLISRPYVVQNACPQSATTRRIHHPSPKAKDGL